MPTELRNIKVDFLSLVSKGANGKKIIYKSGGEKPEGAERVDAEVKKFIKSDERQMVYCPVYSPDEVDSQGEFASRAEIEKAAYGFMKSRNVLNVDADHDFDPKAAFVAESWIAKGVDSLFPDEREGAWIVGIKVEDGDLWAKVKKGELEGVSMAGAAVKIRKSDGGGGMLSKLEEMIGRLLKSDGKAKAAESGGDDKSIDEFAAKIAKAVKDEAGSEFLRQLSELSARLEKVEKTTPGRTGGGIDGGADTGGESCGIA